ncbi:MAG TPA: sialidase family protein [Blastocatellia bacterium]|nr:sialidase family protein [Blastocatellia bacterium]
MKSPRIKIRRSAFNITGIVALSALTLMIIASWPAGSARAQRSSFYTEPRWMAKMRARRAGTKLSKNKQLSTAGISAGKNVNVSNEPGPQSETFIAVNTQNPRILAAGSNEIFRDPLRAYFSTDGGGSWSAADVPLVDEEGTRWSFASDPGVTIDTQGTIFFSQLLISSVDNNFKGDAMIVNRTTDGGATFSAGAILKKDLNAGASGRFEDKPFIACDTNLSSPFRDNVYVAWDTVEGFGNGKVQLARSTDHGVTFSFQRIDDANSGSSFNEIGAIPAVGPNGEVYVAWLDVLNTRLQIDRSFDGGATFGRDSTISQMIIPFDTGIPSIKVRRALVYPSIDVDRSNGPHRGRLYCSWTDQADQSSPFVDGAETDIFFAFSDDGGLRWSAPVRVADDLVGADQFYQWLSVDPVDGSVNISWYDTRNDPARRKTDVYFTRSTDGGLTFSANVRVTTASTDESCPVCEDLIAQTGFTSSTIRFCRQNCDSEIFNQYGDYTGLASFDGASHPVWTDRRTGARLNEEVFTATVKATGR